MKKGKKRAATSRTPSRDVIRLVNLDNDDRRLLEELPSLLWVGSKTEAIVQCLRYTLRVCERTPSKARAFVQEGAVGATKGKPHCMRLSPKESGALEAVAKTLNVPLTEAARVVIRLGHDHFSTEG